MTAYNPDFLSNISPVPVMGLANEWSYKDVTNSLATMETSGFFSIQGDNDQLNQVQVGDALWLVGSDGSALVAFTGLDPFAVSVITVSSSLPDGDIFVGDAGNAAVAVTPSGDIAMTNAGVFSIGANKVLSSMLSPLTLKYAAVTVTLADFIAQYTTPIQLVAAAGANTIIFLKQAQVAQTYGSAALASGGVSAVQYDSTAHGAGVIASTTLSAATYQQTASSIYTYNPGVVVLPFATCVNKGLYLSCLTGDFTTGTGSTFVIHVQYWVVPTA